MKIAFRNANFTAPRAKRLAQINGIIDEYRRRGLRLTLRQLYYQLVSRDIIPNQQKEYKNLSSLLTDGRMSGIVDWSAIEDRLRSVEKPGSWDSPAEIMDDVIYSYAKDRQEGQPNYLEVWVEKDALSGVLEVVTKPFHVPIMVNRGYSSASAMYDSYNRFSSALQRGQKIVLLYLGDHDPSGVDMIRDVSDRPLEMLLAKAHGIVGDLVDKLDDDQRQDLEDDYSPDERTEDEYGRFDICRAYIISRFIVVPIALTRDQVQRYNPPPNPAKVTDSRYEKYVDQHGTHCWEVDALRPEVLNQLLTDAIKDRMDYDRYEQVLKEEKADKTRLRKLKEQLEEGDDEEGTENQEDMDEPEDA